jgi:hypothetical protein
MAEGLILKENRNLARRELIYYLKVTDRQTGQEVGRLGDIHTEGMLLLTSEPLPPETLYEELLLELPKAMAKTEGYSDFTVQAQTIWSKPGPAASTHHENGLRFLNLTVQARKAINLLTEIFAMPSRE